MLSRGTSQAPRIPTLRPLRPPNTAQGVPRPRPFTHKPQLLLVAPHTPRPQLPYLTQPPFRRVAGPSQQLARLLSTENKRYVKDQAYLAAKWALIGWVFIFLYTTIKFGINNELSERENPTPAEWRFLTRHFLRNGRYYLNIVQKQAAGFINWAAVGNDMRNCLERLEDLEKEGKGLMEPADGEAILIPDLGKAGFDISNKSYEWRTGYFEVIMGCAAASEHLDSMVRDRTRAMVFPKQVVIGPSNPDPRPAPPYMHAAPLEENCEAAYEKPETYYMRILTGKGFTTRQQIDAALGYANWLEHKSLNETATEMYRWGVDIAKNALAIPSDAVIDSRSAVLKEEGSREATPNLLLATTALAAHHARTGDLSSALPILLSVLRARRTAPVSLSPTNSSPSKPEVQPTDIGQFASVVKKIFTVPRFPDPPPSGDDGFVRSSEQPTCEDSELMMYIGEMLFATAPESEEGLAWTRSSVEIADANVGPREAPRSTGDEARKCKECLITGVDNWATMLRRLASSQVEAQEREGQRNAGWLEFGGWFGGGGGAKGKTLDEAGREMLEAELAQVGRLKERIVRDGIVDEMLRARGVGPANFLWMGG